MDLRPLLALLSDGSFHSGADLGRQLGVSRTSIWKALNHLPEIGINVESIKGKGYRVLGGLDLLSSESIVGDLAGVACNLGKVDLFLSIPSTNQYLMECEGGGGDLYDVCLSEMQTAGRGRRGRAWVSPFGKNIYLSVAFELQGGVESLSGLSLVVGVAVVRTLRSLGVDSAELKWPNDVLVNGRKIAGILVELQGEATTSWRVVVGLGVNVLMTDEEGEDIGQPWVGLSAFINVGRNELVSSLLKNLFTVLNEFKKQGFAVFIDEWHRYDGLLGRQVQVTGGGIVGESIGVDPAGVLQIKTKNGVELVNAGEVSVRPL